MKKLPLMILMLAFGAFMVTGCPPANNGTGGGTETEEGTDGDETENGEDGETENGDETTEEE